MSEADFCCDEGAILAEKCCEEYRRQSGSDVQQLKDRVENQRSEIKKLHNQIKTLKRQIDYWRILSSEEIAERIFSDLEDLMTDRFIGGRHPAKVINSEKYAELKQKYIRNKEDK